VTGVKVDLSSTDLARIERTVMTMVRCAEDWLPLWPTAGKWYAHRQRRIYETGSYGRWTPLRASTVQRKRREGQTANRPLVETGLLMRSLTSETPRAKGKRYVVFGGSPPAPPYYRWHVKGTGRLPIRNPVPRLSPAERVDLARALHDEFVKRALSGEQPVGRLGA